MNMDWYRPRPQPSDPSPAVLEAQRLREVERVENARWWAEQPARIAARLAEAS